MGKSNKKVKSERVNALRKQYDAFLEEDRKRKERNDYILGRLDKMRFAAVDSKPRYKVTSVVNMRDLSPLGFAESMFHQEYLKPQHQQNRALLPINLGLNNNLNENIILKEIEKKFILIPKLTSVSFNQQEVADSDKDWKSKYNILDQLKLYEKEEPGDLKENTKPESIGQEIKSLDKIEIHPEKIYQNKQINSTKNSDSDNKNEYLLRQNQELANSEMKNRNTSVNNEEYSKMAPNTPGVNDIYAASISNRKMSERDANNILQPFMNNRNNELGPKSMTKDVKRNDVNIINKDTAADTNFGYEGPNKDDTEHFGNESNMNANNYEVNTGPSNEQNTNETIIDDKDGSEKEIYIDDSNTNYTNVTNPNISYEPAQYSTDLPSNYVREENEIYNNLNDQDKNLTSQDTQGQTERITNYEVQSQDDHTVTNEHLQDGNVYNNQYDPFEENHVNNYDTVPSELPSSEHTDAYYPEQYQSQYYQQDENQIQTSEMINNTEYYQNNAIVSQETALNNLYQENPGHLEISNQQNYEQSGDTNLNETIELNVSGKNISNNINENETQGAEETFVNDTASEQYAYNTENYDENDLQQYNQNYNQNDPSQHIENYDQIDPQQYNQNDLSQHVENYDQNNTQQYNQNDPQQYNQINPSQHIEKYDQIDPQQYNQNDPSQHVENYDQNNTQQYNQNYNQNDPLQHIENYDQIDPQQYNQNDASQHTENYDQNDPSQHIENYDQNNQQQYNQSYNQTDQQQYNSNIEQSDPQYNQNNDDQQQYNNEHDQTYEQQYEGQINNEQNQHKNVQENRVTNG